MQLVRKLKVDEPANSMVMDVLRAPAFATSLSDFETKPSMETVGVTFPIHHVPQGTMQAVIIDLGIS